MLPRRWGQAVSLDTFEAPSPNWAAISRNGNPDYTSAWSPAFCSRSFPQCGANDFFDRPRTHWVYTLRPFRKKRPRFQSDVSGPHSHPPVHQHLLDRRLGAKALTTHMTIASVRSGISLSLAQAQQMPGLLARKSVSRRDFLAIPREGSFQMPPSTQVAAFMQKAVCTAW